MNKDDLGYKAFLLRKTKTADKVIEAIKGGFDEKFIKSKSICISMIRESSAYDSLYDFRTNSSKEQLADDLWWFFVKRHNIDKTAADFIKIPEQNVKEKQKAALTLLSFINSISIIKITQEYIQEAEQDDAQQPEDTEQQEEPKQSFWKKFGKGVGMAGVGYLAHKAFQAGPLLAGITSGIAGATGLYQYAKGGITGRQAVSAVGAISLMGGKRSAVRTAIAAGSMMMGFGNRAIPKFKNRSARSDLSAPDYTPREEQLETNDANGKVIDLLEDIEKNTKNFKCNIATESKGILSALSNLIAKIPSLISSIPGIGTAGAAAAGVLATKVLPKVRQLRKAIAKNPVKASVGGLAGGYVLDSAADSLNEKGHNQLGAAAGIFSNVLAGAGTGGLVGGVPGAVIGGIAGGAYGLYDKGSKLMDTSNASINKNIASFSSKVGSMTRSIESGINIDNEKNISKDETSKTYGAIGKDFSTTDKSNKFFSYGAYQFSSNPKAAGIDNLRNWVEKNDPELGKWMFQNEPGTKEFNSMWENLSTDPNWQDRMVAAQDGAAKTYYLDPIMKYARQRSVDTSNRALVELLFSTAIQGGVGAARKMLDRAISAAGGSGPMFNEKTIQERLALIQEAKTNYKTKNGVGIFHEARINRENSMLSDFVNENVKTDQVVLKHGSYSSTSDKSANNIILSEYRRLLKQGIKPSAPFMKMMKDRGILSNISSDSVGVPLVSKESAQIEKDASVDAKKVAGDYTEYTGGRVIAPIEIMRRTPMGMVTGAAGNALGLEGAGLPLPIRGALTAGKALSNILPKNRDSSLIEKSPQQVNTSPIVIAAPPAPVINKGPEEKVVMPSPRTDDNPLSSELKRKSTLVSST